MPFSINRSTFVKIINIQPIEKRVESDGLNLDVHSIFPTIQGEGPFTGHRAIFIRLAGCNLQCPMCDTEYTQGRKSVTTISILNSVLKHERDSFVLAHHLAQGSGTPLVVITGGEPFRQNISELVKLLLNYGFKVQIETNGTLPPPPSFPVNVTVVVSPKAGKVNPKTDAIAAAYKYVLGHDSVRDMDGLPLKALDHMNSGMVARPTRKLPIYLQPRDDHDETANKLNIAAVVKSAIRYGYIVQLQTHKYLEVE